MMEALIFGVGTITSLAITPSDVSFNAGTIIAQPFHVIVYDNSKVIHEYKSKRLATSLFKNGQRVTVVWGEQ